MDLHQKIPDWTKPICFFIVVILVFVFAIAHSDNIRCFLYGCDDFGCRVIKVYPDFKTREKNKPNKNSYCTLNLPSR